MSEPWKEDEGTSDDVRLWRATALLAYLDSDIYSFHKDAFNQLGEKPVPVHDDEGRILGFASVYLTETGIMADISIREDCPQRLDVEGGSIPLYARFYGAMRCSAMPLFDLDEPVAVEVLKIDGIILNRQKPRMPEVGVVKAA